MLAQNKYSNIHEFVSAAQAPLEHLFNNHTFCGNWCAAKQVETMKEKVYEHPEGFLSKEKENDLKIYQSLKEITCKYGSPIYLKQRMPNTQTNEALNQSQAALTPKNKVFHSSKSFHYRHAIMVGTHKFGYRRFWETTFNKIGIKLTDQFRTFLQRIEMNKKRKNERKCNTDVKRRRKHRQEAVEKNYWMKVVPWIIKLELDWT